VRVEIGKLSGVVPDSIRFCFDLCAQSTALEAAVLEIDEIAGRAHCKIVTANSCSILRSHYVDAAAQISNSCPDRNSG
jgi:Zn finger protein HypA/HybF involved in hydrogenase expression